MTARPYGNRVHQPRNRFRETLGAARRANQVGSVGRVGRLDRADFLLRLAGADPRGADGDRPAGARADRGLDGRLGCRTVRSLGAALPGSKLVVGISIDASAGFGSPGWSEAGSVFAATAQRNRQCSTIRDKA